MSEITVLEKYKIPGYEDLSPEEAAVKLHHKKNRAVRAEDDMEFPPYRYMPFPVALYRDWNPANYRREVQQLASLQGVSPDNERQMRLIEDSIPEWETRLVGVKDVDGDGRVIPALRERNEREFQTALSGEWCETPTELRAKKDLLNKAVALSAAERAFDDRRLGELAKRELEAIEDAADDHVVEVPEAPRRGPGRPRKDEA